jgi:hypothetical protein
MSGRLPAGLIVPHDVQRLFRDAKHTVDLLVPARNRWSEDNADTGFGESSIEALVVARLS